MLSRLGYSPIVSYAQDVAKRAASARSFIWYNMNGFIKSIDGTISLINKGSAGSRLNAEAFASNHIYLNGTTNSAPYSITSGIEVCYYDIATKAFIKDTASNPYTMTIPHSSLFSSTVTITDADLAELTADQNKLYRVRFGGETLASGFSNTDIGNFYGGNEGLASGAYIQDLSAALGADNADVSSFGQSFSGINNTMSNINGVYTIHYETADVDYRPLAITQMDNNTSKYLLEITVEITSGTAYLRKIQGLTDTNIDEILPVGTYEYSFAVVPIEVSSRIDIWFNSTAYYTFDATVTVKTKEVQAIEIEAYDSATRTTLSNQSYGASNLKLIRDGSGRTTGIATANTTQWEVDGRTAVTGWTITAPFTITEEIDGDAYDFTSDGNRYKNTVADGTYTLPTGVWTLDEFGFDGVTPVVARGNTKMINEVVVP